MTRESAAHRFEKAAADAVVVSFPEVALFEMRDAPDVDLLHRDGFHVGMEIVRAVDERMLTLWRPLERLTKLIESELTAQNVFGLFRLYFDLAATFAQPSKRAWDRTVPKDVAVFFKNRGQISAGPGELATAGLTLLSHIDVQPADRTFAGCGWSWNAKKGVSAAEFALAKKHEKLSQYRAQNAGRFREYWLAIASLGPGTIEDGGFSLLLSRHFQTDYDRVLLVNHDSTGALVGAQDVTPTE